MTTSKKRSFMDLTDTNHHTTEEPPTKKQKLNELSSNIQSKLFLNSCDNKQFQTIFNSIDNSQLIQQLNISHIISKEIAEYSTGNIEHCANNECKTEIFILNEYIENYECDHENSSELGFKYCYHSNKYYCKKCMEYAVISMDCECDYWNQLYWPYNSDKCTNINCNRIISDCDCSHSLNKPIPCSQCNKGNDQHICYWCYENDNYHRTMECIQCDKIFCNDCVGFHDYDRCICTECEQQTSANCGGNCGQKLNRLCHEEFRYYDDIEYIDSCVICNSMFCESCGDLNYCIGCNQSVCEKCNKLNEGVNECDEDYICNKC
eukprot:440353_1